MNKKSQKLDVAIVGASAIGCICAKECARLGLKTTVFEEHPKVGKQGKCTAIISRRGLDAIGVAYKASVVNTIDGANIYQNKSRQALTVRKKGVAFVLDRQEFDEQCAREARKAGATILLNKKIISLKELNARFIIGADGASSSIATLARFPPIPTKEYALGYEAEYCSCQLEDESIAEIFLDKDRFKGLFAWIVPSGRSRARIGFATTEHTALEEGKRALHALPQVSKALSENARKIREFHALIPLAVRKTIQKENVLLIGDAAGQVKATTGGGIVFGGLSAKLAAQSIAKAIQEKTELDYEKEWRKRLGGHLKKHARIRTLLNVMPNFAMSGGIMIFSALGLTEFLERKGDMDFVMHK